MKALLITLGHNSSALFFNGVDKPIGYEEERLNKIKGSSAFPRLAIGEIVKHIGDELNESVVLISHWFDGFEPEDLYANPKYFDREFMDMLVDRYDLTVLSHAEGNTHHDAHMFSSLAYFKANALSYQHRERKHYIVADGFGNKQEVLSIYQDVEPGQPRLIHRVYGYENSIGLLYQYATSFVGMKENQDEYKFLGYESKVQDYATPDAIDTIDKFSTYAADAYLEFNFTDPAQVERPECNTSFINLDDLKAVKEDIHTMLAEMLKETECPDTDIAKRVYVGYFVQCAVEKIFAKIIEHFNIKNVCLSGGCFYNVKLNNSIMKRIDGFISVMPLAGDQGAAIGMYEYMYPGMFNWFDLLYGTRNLSRPDDFMAPPGIYFCPDDETFVDVVSTLLRADKLVNVVQGEMEFGPRALCNTSTLALPTKANVDYINRLNNRNTVMPMAPVILDSYAQIVFDSDLSRVVGSNRHMVVTHDFAMVDKIGSQENSIAGVMHKYPTENKFSGRPQIIKDVSTRNIAKILSEFKILINTSFNTHGTPILFSVGDCITDFQKQKGLDTENRAVLVIRENG